MGARSRLEGDTLEIIDSMGLARIFPMPLLLLFCTGFLLRFVVIGLKDMILYETWSEILRNVPGMIFTLLMASVFGLLAMMFFFTKKKTLFNKSQGLLRYSLPFGPFRLKKTFQLADVKRVSVLERYASRGSRPYSVVIMPNWVKVEIAWFTSEQKDQALELGRQVADFLGVEFHQEDRMDVSRLENPLSVWNLLKERWRERRTERKDKV